MYNSPISISKEEQKDFHLKLQSTTYKHLLLNMKLFKISNK